MNEPVPVANWLLEIGHMRRILESNDLVGALRGLGKIPRLEVLGGMTACVFILDRIHELGRLASIGGNSHVGVGVPEEPNASGGSVVKKIAQPGFRSRTSTLKSFE